ncbi:hypothetical protein FNI18_06160 [Salmonella enterica subsp. salamae]|nr:hypothetical protein [Salmonella enterica subsp. salamae]
MKKSISDIWVTAQECIGVPGFPVGVSNVRNRLEKLAADHPDAKRKRAGTKAYEYNAVILPQMSKDYFTGKDSLSDAPTSSDQNKNMWMMIYEHLTEEQRQSAIDVFMTGGLRELMPQAIELAAIGSSARKEILQQRIQSGRAQAAGHNVGPQNGRKKTG